MVLDPWVKDIPADAILSPVKFGNKVEETIMSEQSGVAVCAGEPRLKFPLGSEVQMKSVPGFGYTVTAAIKNERALMALDGSCLGLALVHEIEPYCDVDQAHFVSKASMVLWNLGVQDASELASKALYKAGARFPDVGAVHLNAALDDRDITALVGDVCRKLMKDAKYNGVSKDRLTDDSLFHTWHTQNGQTIHGWVQQAIEIVAMVTSRDAEEAIHTVYPHPDEEI